MWSFKKTDIGQYVSKSNYESWFWEFKGCNPTIHRRSIRYLWLNEDERSHSQLPSPLCGFPVSGNKYPTWVPLCLWSVYLAKDLNDPVTLKGHSNELLGPHCLWATRSCLFFSHRHFCLCFLTLWRVHWFYDICSFLRYLSSSVCDKHLIAAGKSKATLLWSICKDVRG